MRKVKHYNGKTVYINLLATEVAQTAEHIGVISGTADRSEASYVAHKILVLRKYLTEKEWNRWEKTLDRNGLAFNPVNTISFDQLTNKDGTEWNSAHGNLAVTFARSVSDLGSLLSERNATTEDVLGWDEGGSAPLAARMAKPRSPVSSVQKNELEEKVEGLARMLDEALERIAVLEAQNGIQAVPQAHQEPETVHTPHSIEGEVAPQPEPPVEPEPAPEPQPTPEEVFEDLSPEDEAFDSKFIHGSMMEVNQKIRRLLREENVSDSVLTPAVFRASYDAVRPQAKEWVEVMQNNGKTPSRFQGEHKAALLEMIENAMVQKLEQNGL